MKERQWGGRTEPWVSKQLLRDFQQQLLRFPFPVFTWDMIPRLKPSLWKSCPYCFHYILAKNFTEQIILLFIWIRQRDLRTSSDRIVGGPQFRNTQLVGCRSVTIYCTFYLQNIRGATRPADANWWNIAHSSEAWGNLIRENHLQHSQMLKG